MSRALVLADVHIPHHNQEALEIALRYGRKIQPDLIILLGDMLDCYQISSYSKDPSMPGMVEEFKQGRAFLHRLRKMFPKARIVYCLGNHEARLEKYIFDHAGKIAGLVGDLMEHHLGTKELCIEVKRDPWMLGKLCVLHGQQLNGRGGVNIPDTLYRQLGVSAICGHFHRSQTKIFTNFLGERFQCTSVGYLGQPMDYCQINQWSTSFATIDIKRDGRFKVNLHEIVDREIV